MIFVDKTWTLFLDRDGVINRKIKGGYVRTWNEFQFIDGVIESLSKCSVLFGHIVIVTNQRGVGKGLMSELDLEIIHSNMINIISEGGGRIDKIYHCSEISNFAKCRKPNIGMAMQAKSDFNKIDFNKSIMIGDSLTDMKFGKALGMKTIYIGNRRIDSFDLMDRIYPSLIEACDEFQKKTFLL